jgi:ribose transport system permease protein
MIIARVSGYWQEIVLGVILILAVGIDIVIQKRAGVKPRDFVKRTAAAQPLVTEKHQS